MHPVTLAILMAAAPVDADSKDIQHSTPDVPPPSNFVAALRASHWAEIYIIPPWIAFAAAPTASSVRISGCKFFVWRYAWDGDTAQWRELEQVLDSIQAEPAPTVRWRQVYYGVVLGDRNGTVREVYTDHMDDPPGKLFALDGRRQVHLPVGFSPALLAFATRHPELAVGPPGRCPTPEEPWPADYVNRHISSNR